MQGRNMRINATNGLDPRSLTTESNKTAGSAKSQCGTDAAACERVESEYAKLLQAAAGTEEVDQAAVAEARRMLNAGELDTPEAARRAAEAMMRIGL